MLQGDSLSTLPQALPRSLGLYSSAIHLAAQRRAEMAKLLEVTIRTVFIA